ADRGGKPERRVVGEPQGVLLVLERRYGGEGAEHLLLEDAHLASDVGEYRRLDEIAVLEARNPCGASAGDEAGALVAAKTAIGQDAIALPGRDHRPQLGSRIEGIADADGFRLGLQLRDELVIDRGLNQVPRGADAGLPRAYEGAEGGIVHR